MLTDKRPIGVFDSGLGGISILRELYKTLPSENFIYLADQANFPYGDKAIHRLMTTCLRNAQFLISRNIKLLVIACNTATCHVIDHIRNSVTIPVVGTVPAVKTAVQQTTTGTIVVLSTPSTAKSLYLKNLCRLHGNNCRILNISCKGLESLIERGNVSKESLCHILHTVLKDVRRANADRVVLGCTHYPLAKPALKELFGSKIRLVDSGRAIARQTHRLLHLYNLNTPHNGQGTLTFLTTGRPDSFMLKTKFLLKRNVCVHKVIIPPN